MIDVEKVPFFNSVNGEIHYFVNITEEKIKELEKVKEKIRNRNDGWGKYPCCDCCIDIIDAEISELKGEQE